METIKRARKTGDFVIVLLTLALTVFGVIMVFSASYYSALSKTGNAYAYLIRDGIWAVAGLIAMFVLSRINYKTYRKWAFPILIASIILLIALFIPHVGTTTNGATRWIELGPITIMPGEIAKIAAIIFVSSYLSTSAEKIYQLKSILFLLALCGIFGGLIMFQPNMSTAITVVGIIVAIMFVAGLELKYLGAAGVLGVVAGCLLIFTDKDGYRLSRAVSFTEPFADPLGAGYQVCQSLLALGSGGLFGLGLGKSIQKNLYLPEPQNDFIIAIIGEELGFIGVLLLMAAYLVLIWRCVHICINAPDRFSMLLASGITSMLAIQVILNIAVVTSSMPPTGIILPFVSYGGNALLIFTGAMGIMLNISHHSAK